MKIGFQNQLLSCVGLALSHVIRLSAAPLKCISGGQIAIMVDGGPSPNTPELLQTLKKANVSALFFLDSEKLTSGSIPNIMRTIVNHGHILGMKLNMPADINDVSNDLLRGGMEEYMRSFTEAIGKTPVFIKVPEQISKEKIDFLTASGYLVTTAELDLSKEWSGNCVRRFNGTVASAGLDSSFVVSIGDTEISCSVQEYEQIIKTAKALGFELVRMDQCINLRDSYRSRGESRPVDYSLFEGPQSENISATDNATLSLSKLSSSAAKLEASSSVNFLILTGAILLAFYQFLS